MYVQRDDQSPIGSISCHAYYSSRRTYRRIPRVAQSSCWGNIAMRGIAVVEPPGFHGKYCACTVSRATFESGWVCSVGRGVTKNTTQLCLRPTISNILEGMACAGRRAGATGVHHRVRLLSGHGKGENHRTIFKRENLGKIWLRWFRCILLTSQDGASRLITRITFVSFEPLENQYCFEREREHGRWPPEGTDLIGRAIQRRNEARRGRLQQLVRDGRFEAKGV